MEIFKAHGTGNDFVVIADPTDSLVLDDAAVVALCDRRFGVGADGVLRLAPADPADDAHVFMDYRNGGDGSIVEMCGNGVRVVAAHLVEHGWTTDTTLRIATRDGVKTATVAFGSDGRVANVTVDMGPPRFAAEALPFTAGAEDDGFAVLDVPEGPVRALTVSMGNPHAVLLCDDTAEAPVTTLGPTVERLPAFPNGTNVEFVAVTGRRSIDLRVWERGVGETLACGTGVCGAVAALVARGDLDAGTDVTVTVPGGTLLVRWDGGPQDPVLLTGPAVEVGRTRLDAAWLAAAGLPVPGDPPAADLHPDRGVHDGPAKNPLRPETSVL